MAIRPLRNRLLIERVREKETKLAGGLFAAEEIAPDSIKATVLAIGPDVEHVKVGQTIFVSQFGPTAVKETVADHTLMVSEDDVLAVLEPSKAAK